MKPIECLWLKTLRARLLAHTRGKTLEVGIGTGLNLPHYPPGAVIVGIEPDQSMRRRALQRLGPDVRVEEGTAENLPFADDEFDTVVATLVLCSVERPCAALGEMRRVLKPGGRLLLMEHARPPQALFGRLSDAITPIWKIVSGGCRLNSDLRVLIGALGLRVVESGEFWNGIGRHWVLEKRIGPSIGC